MTNNPHDKFFRTVMEDKRVARDFLKAHLPKALFCQLDLACLELQPRSQINNVRQESEVDVLFRTKIDGRYSYLYLLIEHQSKSDKLMPFRMLKYMCNIIDHHMKKHHTKAIPLVLPFVVYHGKRPYPYSMNINTLVDAPSALVEQYFLKPAQLIDLGRIEDDELKQHAWAGVMEFALKHIFERDILPYLDNIADLMHRIVQSDGNDYVDIVLQYFFERGELSDKDAFFNRIKTTISHEVGEKIMTGAEQLKAEGRFEGKLEGKLEGKFEIAQKMIDSGLDIAFIEKVTGLKKEQFLVLDCPD